MIRSHFSLFCLLVCIACTASARADVIVGPATLPNNGSGSEASWGLQFTALQNATLTGFDYTHLEFAGGPNLFQGTIELKDLTQNTTPMSIPYGPGTAAPVINFTGLNVPLIQGDVYQLVASSDTVFGAKDQKFTYLNAGTYPVSNSHISVTGAVFNGVNAGFDATFRWPSFTNITTAAAATEVPEPGSLMLFGAALGMGWMARRRLTKKQSN